MSYKKFNELLGAMLTELPRPSGKKATKRPSSNVVASSDYAETQIHEDKFEDASSKPKYVSP